VRREQYQEQGFVFPVEVLQPDEVTRALTSLREVETRCHISLPRIPTLHRFFPWAFQIAANPALLDAVEDLIGPNIIVWGTLVLAKPADGRTFIPWHQDNPYAAFLADSPSVTAWIALTPATRESGCMRIIPGPPRVVLPFTKEKHPDDMLIRGIGVTTAIDESVAVDIELQPGHASLHEISVLHGSHPNCSGAPRIGFIVRYATPAMRPPKYPLYCVRGDPGNVPVSQPPTESPFEAFEEYLRLDGQTPGGAV